MVVEGSADSTGNKDGQVFRQLSPAFGELLEGGQVDATHITASSVAPTPGLSLAAAPRESPVLARAPTIDHGCYLSRKLSKLEAPKARDHTKYNLDKALSLKMLDQDEYRTILAGCKDNSSSAYPKDFSADLMSVGKEIESKADKATLISFLNSYTLFSRVKMYRELMQGSERVVKAYTEHKSGN